MLSIDYAIWPPGTLWIQMANFLLLLFLMNIFLLRPIRGILAQRNEEVSSLQKTIEAYHHKSEQSEMSIEQGLVEARKEGSNEKEGFKGLAVDEERGILGRAGSAAEEKIEKAMEEINGKMDGVRRVLEEELGVFSEELAERILGRKIQ